VSVDARVVHLLSSGEVFRVGYPSTPLAACGEPVTSEPDGDEENPGYCPDCVSSAIRWMRGMSADIEPCPCCGSTSDVKVITDTSLNVQAWICAACGAEWALTVVNPRSYLDYLAATVELAGARSALRALLTLADDAPTLSDEELRSRLTALAGRAVMKFR
jgi:hypothetical protein